MGLAKIQTGGMEIYFFFGGGWGGGKGGGQVLKISANVTKGIRGRGHQKRFDLINTAPVFLSLPLGRLCATRRLRRGGKGGEERPRLLLLKPFPSWPRARGKLLRFPFFLKNKIK